MPDTPDPVAVVIAIGNSDDKLTQAQWSRFYRAVNELVTEYEGMGGVTVYGRWLAASDSPRQNAGWSLSFGAPALWLAAQMNSHLREICHGFHQDSHAWTQGTTEIVPSRAPMPGSELPEWVLETS